MPEVALDPSEGIFRPSTFTGANDQQLHANVCGTQLDQTYYLKNNEAKFVSNSFTEKESVKQKHLQMSGLNDPDEVMWKLV